MSNENDVPSLDPMKYTPPKDIKQWWCSAHCGPATDDSTEECGFCGLPVLECARLESDAIREHPEYNFDRLHLGTSGDDPEVGESCGGSGFWCSACGRFWAQDSCGGAFGRHYQASDGAKLLVDANKVYCTCGKWLMTERTR